MKIIKIISTKIKNLFLKRKRNKLDEKYYTSEIELKEYMKQLYTISPEEAKRIDDDIQKYQLERHGFYTVISIQSNDLDTFSQPLIWYSNDKI